MKKVTKINATIFNQMWGKQLWMDFRTRSLSYNKWSDTPTKTFQFCWTIFVATVSPTIQIKPTVGTKAHTNKSNPYTQRKWSKQFSIALSCFLNYRWEYNVTSIFSSIRSLLTSFTMKTPIIWMIANICKKQKFSFNSIHKKQL